MVRRTAKRKAKKQPACNTWSNVIDESEATLPEATPLEVTQPQVTSDDGRSSRRSKGDGSFFSALSELEDAAQSADDTALSSYEVAEMPVPLQPLERPMTRSSFQSSGSASNWSDDNLSTVKGPTRGPVSRRPIGGKIKAVTGSELSDVEDSDTESDETTTNLSVIQKFIRNSRIAEFKCQNKRSTSTANDKSKNARGPKGKANGHANNTAASSSEDEDDPPPKRQRIAQSNKKKAQNRRTFSDVEETFRNLDDEVDDETKYLFGKLMECVRNTDVRSKNMDTKLDRLEIKAETIEIKLEMIMSCLMRKNQADAEAEQKEMPDLPLRHMYDMDKLEILLSNKKHFADMETKLSRMPSKNVQGLTRRIMEKLFHYKVAACLNWVGKNDQKLPIKSLKITELLIAAVFKKYEDADAKVVTHTIKQWLKDAPAREKRRKKVD